jgi:PKHD-type hydroxylase
MYITIPNLLNEKELGVITELCSKSQFINGKLTASGAAQQVKNNEQLDMADGNLGQINAVLENALNQSPLLIEGTQPKSILPFLVSRYMPGMEYGWHVDSPLMSVPPFSIRADLSITVFLNSPSDYEGGELEIETEAETRLFKLQKGDAIIYPTTKVHRVRPVSSGMRMVAVSWIQSMVRNTEQRDLLFQLKSLQQMLEQQQKGSQLHLLSQQVHSNLLRMLSEI